MPNGEGAVNILSTKYFTTFTSHLEFSDVPARSRGRKNDHRRDVGYISISLFCVPTQLHVVLVLSARLCFDVFLPALMIVLAVTSRMCAKHCAKSLI